MFVRFCHVIFLGFYVTECDLCPARVGGWSAPRRRESQGSPRGAVGGHCGVRLRAASGPDALRYGDAGDEPPEWQASAVSRRRLQSRTAAGDWLSGRAPRSHRGGHWFDPSIAHHDGLTRTCAPRARSSRSVEVRSSAGTLSWKATQLTATGGLYVGRWGPLHDEPVLASCAPQHTLEVVVTAVLAVRH